jgi:hypothetical protein
MSVADFDRVRKLGKGGQASVQLWKSKKDGRLMAVKVFKDRIPVNNISSLGRDKCGRLSSIHV